MGESPPPFTDRRSSPDRRQRPRRDGEKTAQELENALEVAQADGETMAEELRRKDEHYRLLVESVVDYAIFTLDPDGIVTSWNAGAERLKGWREDEVCGKHFSIFYTQKAREEHLPETLLQRARDEGHVQDTGWRVRKDGSRFLAHVTITAMHDRDGNVVGFAKITKDMTQSAKVDALAAQVEDLISVTRDLHGAVQESRRVAAERAALAQRQIRQRSIQFLALVLLVSLAFVGMTALLRASAQRARVRIAQTVMENCQHVSDLQDTLIVILQGFRANAAGDGRRQIDLAIERLMQKPCLTPPISAGRK